ncbi:unnamed protein product (macronuclear) [Paramecium tetraurelia]|uniref:Uncharacterized protein n=1 Tax=Paramecium tetraurelia TaxID=5888 RepID=A0DKY0_PARTE|nr:uncharacterized protein GSPATT00018014001 [Paramecium tetraurelia]CAK83697.1 unnamed protein product [Paramecium tetraurelia]|eukprot:XP_001451094.1 hypothetical protein (macronuclear) [Paramecium tetraurelia strain d4-2]
MQNRQNRNDYWTTARPMADINIENDNQKPQLKLINFVYALILSILKQKEAQNNNQIKSKKCK